MKLTGRGMKTPKMRSMRRRVATLTAAFAVGALAACGGDGPTTPTTTSVAGTWSLRTINGANLPYTIIQIGADKVELTADVLTVSSGGSFAEISSYRETENGVVTTFTESDAGTYTLNGTAVTFSFNSGGTGTGTISGNTLTVAAEGFSFVFQKQ